MGKKHNPINTPKAAVYYSRTAIRRVWLYCRVASQDALALEMQERHLREYVYQHGWSVEGISTDQHVSTTLLRPCLAELSKAVTDGKVDTVLVFNLGCLCRSMEDATRYWNFLRKHGVDLHSVNEGKVDLSIYNAVSEALKKIRADSVASVAHVKD